MTQHTVTLEKGLTIGEERHTKVVLRELSAGDLIAAMEESERLIMVPGANGAEPALVTSNTLMGINTLRRQVASIGSVDGPMEREQLSLLSNKDLEILHQGVAALDTAIVNALEARGRSAAADQTN